VPPRFVPTLTEVVAGVPAAAGAITTPATATANGAVAAPVAPLAPQSPNAAAFTHASATPVPLTGAPTDPTLASRVLARLEDSLEERLAEAVESIARQHALALTQHLREQLEDLVSQAVHDAVAQELGTATRSPRG
jgi:hypothetical protein